MNMNHPGRCLTTNVQYAGKFKTNTTAIPLDEIEVCGAVGKCIKMNLSAPRKLWRDAGVWTSPQLALHLTDNNS